VGLRDSLHTEVVGKILCLCLGWNPGTLIIYYGGDYDDDEDVTVLMKVHIRVHENSLNPVLN
jgi:hypothetical protein